MPPASKPKSNQPCPCGSGKKYRECHAVTDQRRRKLKRQSVKVLGWAGAIALVAAILYGTSTGVAYNERRIAAVNFSGLNASQKRTALRAAQAARCNCGCGM